MNGEDVFKRVSTVEDLLDIPRKIDIFHYAPGAGGEFFQSMVALSCPKTRKLLKMQHLNMSKEGDRKAFKRAKYKNSSCPFPTQVFTNRFSLDEIINIYKFNIVNAIVNTENQNYYKYKDILYLFTAHYTMSKRKMKEFSSYKYWDVVNLNPINDYSKKLLFKMGFHLPKADPNYIEECFKYDFLDSMPFLDYMLYQDYPSIMSWIENRYGSEMDFDFIEKSLKMWREVRVVPYL